MERRLVGVTMTLAPVALAVSAIAAGVSLREPVWWRAAVQLAVLGGIAMMIYAVNIRVVPVFARRQWRSVRLLRLQVIAAGTGAWLSFFGIGLRSTPLTGGGQLLVLAGGVLFMVNIVSLFREEPAGMPAPPLRFGSQAAVDRIATKFMRLSGTYLLLGLTLGVALVWWRPGSGRWDLVWAHAMLLGFFLSMASGVCYHVLSRWSGVPWKSVGAIRVHYLLVAVGLPAMVLALAVDASGLFLIAGPLQAAAIALMLINIAPHALRLGGAVRAGILLAVACLAFGITLGVVFAIDPAVGARSRQIHAVVNLFGWGALLISGFGYAFAPNFAGVALRWARLAALQLGVLACGVLASTAVMFWRIYGGGPDAPVIVAQNVIAFGLLLFAVQVAGVFLLDTGPSEPVVIRPGNGIAFTRHRSTA
jgi:hypothetical protein